MNAPDVWIGDEGFYVHDDIRTLEHAPCGTHLFGDTTIAAHVCFECVECREWFTELPEIDTENGSAYCSADCLDNASERYWMGVWSA